MPRHFSRWMRALALTLAASGWTLLLAPSASAQDATRLRAALATLETGANGRLGLALISGRGALRFAYRGNEPFPFCSTFKLLLVGSVLQRSMNEPRLLSRHIDYTEQDVLAYAPITRQNLATGLSVDALCAAALQYSDNTATNLLLDVLGGVKPVGRFARRLGDRAFRLDRREPDLNSAIPGDPRDTTTPAAMATDLRTLVFGDVLAPPQRQRFTHWIKGNTTGAASIRAGVPSDWSVGDKTGSGAYGTTNDVAVLWPPQSEPLVLAVFFTQPDQGATPNRDVLAAATRLVLSTFSHSRP